MAERRMLTKKITSSARYIKMPTDSQALYTQLCMNADDDGVVEAFSILNLTGIREDNLRVLSAKKFIKILNEDLVSYIMNWTDMNQIRPDRKVNSIYKKLLISILPDIELVEPTPRIDVKNNSKRLGNGQSTDSPRTVHINKKDKKKDVDSPRTAQYRVVEGSVVEDSKKNTVSDFSTKNSDDEKDSQYSEKDNFNSPEELLPRTSQSTDSLVSSAVAKTTTFSFSEKLSEMKNDKRRHIQIIALYWKFKKFNYTNEKQYKSAISRDLKSSSNLSGYSDEQIIKTMQWLEKNATNYIWKLETVHKYIDENGSEETPFEEMDDATFYDLPENQGYRCVNSKLSELSPEEQEKYLAWHKQYQENLIKAKTEPIKPIDYKSFADDFKKKDNSPITLEQMKKIKLIDF